MDYRLNKYISNSGYCSRREADRFIEDGKVTVNGKRAVVGMRVLPGQKVSVNGERIVNVVEPVYIALNKPVGVVSTTDLKDKNNIVNFVSHEQRIFPIGRLDKDSQGLILLTNDGDIVNKILRAGNSHKKEYLVTVNKPITKDFLTRMAQGVPILDRVTRGCELTQINPYMFRISLIQGLNRQIRRMCEYFDYGVTKLERIQIMNIKLESLGQGNWRDLTPAELEGLFDMLEDSEKTAGSKKKPFNSNKSFNRALEDFDVRTNHRKGSIAAKYTKGSRPEPTQTRSSTSARTEGKPGFAAKYKGSRPESTQARNSTASRTEGKPGFAAKYKGSRPESTQARNGTAARTEGKPGFAAKYKGSRPESTQTRNSTASRTEGKPGFAAKYKGSRPEPTQTRNSTSARTEGKPGFKRGEKIKPASGPRVGKQRPTAAKSRPRQRPPSKKR